MSIVVAGIVFACTFGGAMLGMSLRSILPESHLDTNSKEAIRLTTGLLATLAALVMGLLIASAKSGFDAQDSGFQQLAANVVVLDKTLLHYGPEADHARKVLHRTVNSTIAHLWPENHQPTSGLESAEISANGGEFHAAVRDLAPSNDVQRTAQSQALQIGTDMARTRWLLSQPQDNTSLIPFLVVLLFWLVVIFASFGLFSPRNAVVLTALFVCAVSAAGAVFLIVDLNQPAGGLIQISSAPLRFAESQLGK